MLAVFINRKHYTGTIVYDLIKKSLKRNRFTIDNSTIRIMNDYHGNVKYYLLKYEEDNIITVYIQKYNWFDVYYKYGNPNSSISCNSDYGIVDGKSPATSTLIILYGNFTYSPEDSNDNIYIFNLLWSRFLYYDDIVYY